MGTEPLRKFWIQSNFFSDKVRADVVSEHPLPGLINPFLVAILHRHLGLVDAVLLHSTEKIDLSYR